MRAIKPKNLCADKFLSSSMKSIRRVPNMRRAAFSLASFLGLALLLFCSSGCAPSSPQTGGDGSGGQTPSSQAANGLPEITDEIIRERINRARVRQVPEENGASEPISWSFYVEEPKDITVVDKQIEGDSATIVLDIKTKSTAGAREQRYLAGQIRTKWKLETGWALREWEIVETENISMKYKNLPKPPPAQNSNR